MRIRNKLLALTIVLVTLYTVCLLSAILLMTNTTFLDAERSLAQKDIHRIVNSMGQEFDGLTVAVRDYALWDDTWKFMNGTKPTYIEENFSDTGLDNLNVSVVAFYDSRGELRKALFHERSRPVGDCPFCPTSINQDPALQGIIRNKAGFIKIEHGLFLVAAASIYKTDLSGSAIGTMVMARLVDPIFIQNLRERSDVFVEEYAGPFPSGGVRERSQYNLLTTMLLDKDGSHISGFIEFMNENNEPVFLLRTETDRTLLTEGMNFASSIVILFCLVAVLFGIAINAAFRIWITQPLANIETALDSFSFGLFSGDIDNSNPQLSTLYSRQDELGHFADVIKQMNTRMHDSHSEVLKIKGSLEKMIQKRTEDLVSSNSKLEMFKKILENTSEAVIITDVNGRILDINDAMTVMTGFDREELLGQDFCLFNSFKQEPDFRERLIETMQKNGHWEGEVWDRRKDGSVFPKWQTVNTIYDETGAVVNYVGVSTDISVLKEAEETLNHLAYYDPLTGLPNRMLFSDRLEHQIACSRRIGTIFGLLFIDLDRFKTVNDTMGHLMGDALLVSVAERLKEAIRDSDTLCRIGGDEFALILQDLADSGDAGLVAADIVQKISEPFQIEASDIYIGASIGISLFPRDGTDPETLLRKADAAMYLAKDGGKGMYCFASGEMERVNKSKLEIETKMHKALERQEFRLFYQPQNYVTQAIPGMPAGLIGVEALIRWIPEPNVIISPGDFLPVAEETGFIAPLGDWVMYQACCDAKKWLDLGKPVQVSVNVSARQFESGNLSEHVSAVLSSTGLPPNLLKLEVTESGCMRNIDHVTEVMCEIREKGVSFAIDDFGTGYCSLQYLHQLPVDCLKIDQSFIRSMDDGHSGGDIVSAIISMARAFGLSSIAEGVETCEQLEKLRIRGCDIIQGYLVSRPLSYDDFMKYLMK